jgi:hypothetical protein
VVRARGRVPALAAVSGPAVGFVFAQTPGCSPPQTSGNFHLALSLGCQKANAWLPPVRVAMYGKLREGKRRSRSDFAGGAETNPSGSDNLPTGVCAVISYEYSLFGLKAASSSERLGLYKTSACPNPLSKSRLPSLAFLLPIIGEPAPPQSDAVEATAELSQLSWLAADRCEVFPVALRVEAIQLNRRSSNLGEFERAL